MIILICLIGFGAATLGGYLIIKSKLAFVLIGLGALIFGFFIPESFQIEITPLEKFFFMLSVSGGLVFGLIKGEKHG